MCITHSFILLGIVCILGYIIFFYFLNERFHIVSSSPGKKNETLYPLLFVSTSTVHVHCYGLYKFYLDLHRDTTNFMLFHSI
jgi:hypothetical protein